MKSVSYTVRSYKMLKINYQDLLEIIMQKFRVERNIRALNINTNKNNYLINILYFLFLDTYDAKLFDILVNGSYIKIFFSISYNIYYIYMINQHKKSLRSSCSRFYARHG